MKPEITLINRSWEEEFAAQLFEQIAEQSADEEGISRPAFSAIETDTLETLKTCALSHDLNVTYDRGCNAIFSLPEDTDAEEFILIGSHADSVPRGGNFDGLAGIIAGLVCLVKARREGHKFNHPVKVIALRGEESAWFGPCYVASKALMGVLEKNELSAPHKGDGRELIDHMADIGVDVAAVRDARPLMDRSQILEYLELHIEQGPMLVEKKLPAAVVSGIRGNVRYKSVTCIGETGHSGAVPRAYRHDPVLAMADLLNRLDESWMTILQKGNDLVLTSGMVATDPATHALSRIPDRVDFSLDIRSQDTAALKEMQELLKQEASFIGKDRGVKFEFSEPFFTAPALCNSEIVAGLIRAQEQIGQNAFVMPSGGGHDAAVFANAGIPTGMIFVRNRGGSHNPGESMEIGDFVLATEIIFEYLTSPSGREVV
ncbi:MAG: Zn-dependent hydrolase [Fimbriimonadaceae bacterium]|nr:Zn-dependent hydrolase [Alphaproteobacteria bacterium]